MKIGLLLALLVAIVLLTGCLDIEEDIVINADGSGSYRMAMVMDESVASMMEDGESEPLIDENDYENAESKTYIDADGNYVQEANIYFDDIEAFVDEYNQNSEDGGIVLAYEAGDSGSVIFTHTIEGSNADSGGALGDAGDLISAEMLDGLEWKLSITVPGIEDTNGNLSEDETTASWSIPLTMLSSPQGHEAYVEYSSGGFNFDWTIGAIVIGCCFALFVLVVGILGLFFFVRSRSKATTEAV